MLNPSQKEGGMIICEGKTKRIVTTDNPNEVIIETKDDLTGGDAAKKETIQGISEHKTTQASNVFELLNRSGIDTAFIKRTSKNEMLTHKCDMLPLEIVMRRFAWGSYLKRCPDFKKEKPHRFDQIQVELFHKHAVVMPPLADTPTQMEEGEARGKYLRDGVWKEGVYTDPLIVDEGEKWFLYPAKEPMTSGNQLMEIQPALTPEEKKKLVNDIAIPVFEALEKAWSKIETSDGAVSLVDIKIEAGRRASDGAIVVADVIDNDSWRIWPGGDPTKQLDKQCFRDGYDLNDVANKYQLVAGLTQKFL